MKKFKYLKISNTFIIFLPGFMSDIKVKNLGHGKSSGIFTKGNISIWTSDAKSVIKKIVKKNNFIIIELRLFLNITNQRI